MKLEWTADYAPASGCGKFGDVIVRINGAELLWLDAERKPGAEPHAEENVINETVESFFGKLWGLVRVADPGQG
jgi:hypothetical protein